jgi:hypothetical protein
LDGSGPCSLPAFHARQVAQSSEQATFFPCPHHNVDTYAKSPKQSTSVESLQPGWAQRRMSDEGAILTKIVYL